MLKLVEAVRLQDAWNPTEGFKQDPGQGCGMAISQHICVWLHLTLY